MIVKYCSGNSFEVKVVEIVVKYYKSTQFNNIHDVNITCENYTCKGVPWEPNQEIKPEPIVVIALWSYSEAINRLVEFILILCSDYEEINNNVEKEKCLTNC